MFIINGTAPDLDSRCFVFDSVTIALVIAEKLESQGFAVEIMDRGGEPLTQFPSDPYRHLLGARITREKPKKALNTLWKKSTGKWLKF